MAHRRNRRGELIGPVQGAGCMTLWAFNFSLLNFFVTYVVPWPPERKWVGVLIPVAIGLVSIGLCVIERHLVASRLDKRTAPEQRSAPLNTANRIHDAEPSKAATARIEGVTHSFRLTLKGIRDQEWLLEWNDTEAALTTPTGEPAFLPGGPPLYRTVDLFDVFVKNRISFETSSGPIKFNEYREAYLEFRKYLERRLDADSDYRRKVKLGSLSIMPVGIAVFIIATVLVVLCCRWMAAIDSSGSAPHWVYSFGWLLALAPVVLSGVALAGPVLINVGYRDWRAIRKLERDIRPKQ